MSVADTSQAGPVANLGSGVHDQSTSTTSPELVSQRPSWSAVGPPATTASIASRTRSASSGGTYRSQKTTPPVSSGP
jgi:hypothetical protein